MLRYNFNRIFQIRGISRPYTFLTEHGFKKSYATRLIGGKINSMKADHMERFCLLLKCTPNDIMEWEPDNEEVNVESHPLKELIREEHLGKVKTILRNLPLEELDEVFEYIRARGKE